MSGPASGASPVDTTGVLRTTREGVVTHVVLARPDRANALDAALVEALLDAVDAATADGTRLFVLSADGRNFSGGFDFTGYESSSEGRLLLRFVRIEQLLQRLWHAPFATLAFAHGRNFGAGVDLLAACDVRIAAPGSTFRMPGLRFGLQLGTRRLAARIGAEKAHAVLATSRNMDTAEALDLGLVTAVTPMAEWTHVITREEAAATSLSPDAAARLRRAVKPDTRAQDLADLVESVVMPGLKDRIARYRSGG